MTIKQFVGKAVQGGWKIEGDSIHRITNDVNRHGNLIFEVSNGDDTYRRVVKNQAEILLDREAWQAVGTVEGWEDKRAVCAYCKKNWMHEMHQLVDALAEGKTITEFLDTL